MNITHLGDAYDHWKGCTIRLVRAHLSDLRVLPMFTDATRWSEDQLRLYSDLLGLCRENFLLAHERYRHLGRRAYFKALSDLLPDTSDVFVDPDTGVEPESGPSGRHLCRDCLALLVPDGSDRMALLYQHSSRRDNWTRATLNSIATDPGPAGCSSIAYWAGAVSMLFVCRKTERLAVIKRTLDGYLASVPSDRRRVVTSEVFDSTIAGAP